MTSYPSPTIRAPPLLSCHTLCASSLPHSRRLGSWWIFFSRSSRYSFVTRFRLFRYVTSLRRDCISCMPSILPIGEFSIIYGCPFIHGISRDCCRNNFMMDPSPLFYTGFHPINPAFTKDYRSRSQTKYRTAAPVKYYLIDFGESKYYDPKINPPLDRPGRTQDRSVPEYDVPGLYNPFLTDVYLIGNMIKSHVMAVCTSFHHSTCRFHLTTYVGLPRFGFHDGPRERHDES